MADEERKAGGFTRRVILTVAGVALIASAAVTALLVNIMERKQEARSPYFRVVEP